MRKLIALSLLLAGCGPVTPPILAPVWPTPLVAFPQERMPSDIRLTALFRGPLILENGCLRAGGHTGSSMLIIWPTEAAVQGGAGRPLRIVDTLTGFGVQAGDTVSAGGGSSSTIGQGFLREPIPSTCPGPYFGGYGFHMIPAADWPTFRARGPYTVRIPPGMVEVAMVPIDSAPDHLITDGLRLNFDYGRYGCGVMQRDPRERRLISTAFVDGKAVGIDRYVTETNDIGEFGDRIHAQVPNLDAAGTCLAIHAMCRTDRDCDIARAVIDSIDFDPQG